MNSFTKDDLYDLYIFQKKPMHEIADVLGIAVGTVYNYMKKYNIQSREPHQGMTGKKLSMESREKISQKLKGRVFSRETVEKMAESKRLKGEGHRKKSPDGYIKVYYPSHPKAKNGYIQEHRLIMEKYLGRMLNDDEVVHHINHIRDDNRIDNLQVMTFKEHSALHMRERWAERKGR